MKRSALIFLASLLALTVGLGPSQASGQQTAAVGAGSPRTIRFISIFDVLPGINAEDARLSLEMIMRKTMARQTHPFRVELDFITDYSNVVESITRGRYHFVTLTGMDYVDLNRSVPLSPMMVLSKLEQPTEALILVTRKGETLDRIGRKPNATLILEEGRVGAMARMWLDTVLWEQEFEASDRHFAAIQYAQKTSRILLPVFFGKADACVISASAFNLMSDLNPQIANRLTIQQQSEGLVSLLLCATSLAQPEDKSALSTEAKEALEDPYSRQALTMVQMKRFFASRPEYLLPTEALFQRYHQLAAQKDSLSPSPSKATRAQ